MNSEDTKPQSAPWHWPREWWHDHTFWRDVATRTVAGLIVVSITAVVAMALGYIATPDGQTMLFALGVASVAIVLIVISEIIRYRIVRSYRPWKKLPRKEKLLVALIWTASGILFILFIGFTGMPGMGPPVFEIPKIPVPER
jgi:amino acid transporter